MLTLSSLSAKEVFDFSLTHHPRDFDYRSIRTASFFFPGNKDLDVDTMIKSIVKDRANIVITGNTSIEGEALSPNISTFVVVRRSDKDKLCLVTINSSISGISPNFTGLDGEKYRGDISILDHILILSGEVETKELENAISSHLKILVDNITTSAQAKPKFFIVH